MNNIDRMFTSDASSFAAAYLRYVAKIIERIDTSEIVQFVETLLQARASGATIFFVGNGGSAATASHFANDLAIGTNDTEMPFRALSLTDNVAVISAIGNDYGYEDIFSRQLSILGQSGDVVVAISASGNSPNLLKAFEVARAKGIRTVALTAFDGGKMKTVADQGVHVRTDAKEYGPAEDAHMVLDHLVTAYLTRIVRQGERNSQD